jgi:protein-glucosylgalactosylhydroxylysine glucosidase
MSARPWPILAAVLLLGACVIDPSGNVHRIDRESLVRRHIPSVRKPDPMSPFSVGNGEFAFTAGITGLQTFSSFYEDGIPLLTESQWGWHTFPNPEGYALDQTFQDYETYGREVPYASDQRGKAGQWLRANPQRINLGRIGFRLQKADGSAVQPSDLTNVDQTLDLWQGIINSHFTFEGREFVVETTCHPTLDQIAVRIEAEALHDGKTGILFKFPYPSPVWGKDPSNWQHPDGHSSVITRGRSDSVEIERTIDGTRYGVGIQWEGSADFKEVKRHSFILEIHSGGVFQFTCRFLRGGADGESVDTAGTFRASIDYWKKFWTQGGAIDFSGSTDPRASELERRIVLSRYLTAVQCAGTLPPQETGLTFNSWYGKFHLEMHWWHAAHFVPWGHPEMLERSLSWYSKILPQARQKAERQGYAGVRWPKMVGPDGRESPSAIGVFLIWQQPHLIYDAELLYRYYGKRRILDQYKDLVFQTADFMASYAHLDVAGGRCVLGPPLIPAQEIYGPESVMDPAFELSYWRFGLETAQAWRDRLGQERSPKWDEVLDRLSSLPMHDGLYQNAETALDTFSDPANRRDHPALLGAYGMLPNETVNRPAMKKTLQAVLKSWNWESTWGWDFPLMAMTAARVGAPDLAVDALLMDVQKNTYLNNGHNYQNERLPIYLPGNGGLLMAVDMMAAGWDDAADVHAPGFPKDGTWKVEYEGLQRLP